MRTGLVPVPEALEIVLADAAPGAEETVALKDAAFRVLSRDLAAKRTQPPFPASAMDGYAVRAEDAATVPVTLKLIGQSAAGHPFAGEIGLGEAVRIFTGAAVPKGADTIVIQENTQAGDGSVTIEKGEAAGRHIRVAGLDFTEGDVLLERGTMLGPQQLALAASMNHARLPVYVRPKVALMATGDELVEPGGELRDGAIIASNTFGLAAIITAAGGEVIDLGIIGDTKEALTAAYEKALQAGSALIVTTGGASVGDHDLIKPVLLSLGAVLDFEKLAMRPGKPMLSGRLKRDGHEARILGLAGNPVSSLVAGNVFMRPLVGRLAGRPVRTLAPVPAVLGTGIAANDERQDYMRALATRRADGTLVVSPMEKQDSSMLGFLARADALLVRPVNAPAAKKGDECQVILLREN